MITMISGRGTIKLRKAAAATVVLLALSYALYSRTEEDPFRALGAADGFAAREGGGDGGKSMYYDESVAIVDPRTTRQLDEADVNGRIASIGISPPDFNVCGRSAGSEFESSLSSTLLSQLQETYAAYCPAEFDPETPTLVLHGRNVYGRTGNHLRALLRAVQMVRDEGYQLVLMRDSWAVDVILQLFLANDDSDHRDGGDDGGAEKETGWESRLEKALCVKVVSNVEELRGWKLLFRSCRRLFEHRSPGTQEEFIATQSQILQSLYRHVNTVGGHDNRGEPARDMCSGIDSIFGDDNVGIEEEGKEEEDAASPSRYSVIHLRQLESDGMRILAKVSDLTGCDRFEALRMGSDYVKSILEPLGMLDHPIVVITDHENANALRMLRADPEIGPVLRTVPKEGSWIGGDITLGVMADVFIGNPASTFSQFIAQSRMALGFRHSYLYLARDWKNKEWRTVCGEKCCGDECVFLSGTVSRPRNYDGMEGSDAAAALRTRTHDRPDEGVPPCGDGCIAILRKSEISKRYRKRKRVSVKNFRKEQVLGHDE